MRLFYQAYFAFCIMAMAGCEETARLSVKPAGDEKSLKTRVLEKGAYLLQDNSPLHPMTIYLVGFHAAKHDPSHQMEAIIIVIRPMKILLSVFCLMAILNRQI